MVAAVELSCPGKGRQRSTCSPGSQRKHPYVAGSESTPTFGGERVFLVILLIRDDMNRRDARARIMDADASSVSFAGSCSFFGPPFLAADVSMTGLRSALSCKIACCLFVALSNEARAGGPVYLGNKSAATIAIDDIDHQIWDTLLREYVDQDGMVNYRDWKASREDMRRLDNYIQALSAANLSAPVSRSAKLAFFINAYNAVTIKGILREYPTSSIRNHTAKLLGYNIWKDLQLYVGGVPLSLDAIEHKMLRKLSEPRIHFAIVCASIGCPRLLSEAYVADRLDQQLESSAIDFFRRSPNFKFDRQSKTFYLSSILDWFGEDFGRSRSARLKSISRWVPAGPARQAAALGEGNVEFLDYDWGLNEQ